jgi:hypothetical protein
MKYVITPGRANDSAKSFNKFQPKKDKFSQSPVTRKEPNLFILTLHHSTYALAEQYNTTMHNIIHKYV